VFAFLPTWLHRIDERGFRRKTRRAWMCFVTERMTMWDGWVAFDDEN
jgi:hypothetical protein